LAVVTAEDLRAVGNSMVERLSDALTAGVDRLPSGLRRYLPRDLVGFAVLGGCTFLVDLALLAALRTWTPLPLPAAVTIAYVIAFGLNFSLNRTVNFRSHAPIAGQAVRYTIVISCDFLLTLGVTTGLTALGLDFRLARLAAAGCVAAFTYTAARWWVFRDQKRPVPEGGANGPAAKPQVLCGGRPGGAAD
jgi:putative flippase GtrA